MQWYFFFTQTAGKPFLLCFILWGLLLWCSPSLVGQCLMLQAPSRGYRPIKGHFTSFLLVFHTTTARVELSTEARPILCISMLQEEEEARSPFVTCIRLPGGCKLVTWSVFKMSSKYRRSDVPKL